MIFIVSPTLEDQWEMHFFFFIEAYEMVMPYHLHMPSYFLETFTEYP